jgi:hypothetical protein
VEELFFTPIELVSSLVMYTVKESKNIRGVKFKLTLPMAYFILG